MGLIDSNQIGLQLEDLWDELRDLASLTQELRLDDLNEHERNNVIEFSKITSGYACMLIEIEDMRMHGNLPCENSINDLSALIQSHCDAGIPAIQQAILYQNQTPLSSIRYSQ